MVLKKMCPWCFSKEGEEDSDDSDDEGAAMIKKKSQKEPSAGSADKTPDAGSAAAPPPPASGGKTDPANAPTAEELDSEFTDEIGQLARIIALMIAECVFAYEEPFEIELESQFAMMFDMQLSFSFNSLKEAERQLMSALAEIFAKKESAAFFFKSVDEEMHTYLSDMSATDKFEYKQKSGFGRPEKLHVALSGQYAPTQDSADSYKMCVEYWDHTCRKESPFRYDVMLYQAGSLTGTSPDIRAMKAKKQ